MEEFKMNEEKIDLIKEFGRVQWLFHRYHLQNHTHHGPMGDPSRGQGRVLTILKMNPEISQKDLLYLLDMRAQSLGEILSKLEKIGYITRTPSETDRRVMNIKLTTEGIGAVGAPKQEFNFDKLFECMSQEEQKNLSGYLRRIIETLEAQLGDEQPLPAFDPGFQMGQNHPGTMPFEQHPGYMPLDGHPGISRGQEERPAPSQNKPYER
jgi:DNA-binding MarR family transcriptional regulator